MIEKFGHRQLGLHWCLGNLAHLQKMQIEAFYMALLIVLLLLVLMELRAYSIAEYFTFGFLSLTVLQVLHHQHEHVLPHYHGHIPVLLLMQEHALVWP